MKAARHLITELCAAALIALAASVIPTTAAQAEPSWTRLRASDFPAHVKAIVFASGIVLEAGSIPVCWGNWCASFGTEPPVAIMRSNLFFMIEKVEFRNPVEGVKPGGFALQISHDNCQVFINRYNSHILFGGSSMRFKITCPKDLILK